MPGKRKICVVTGTRAEYGLLYWLLMEIRNDTDLELQLVVTGMHLSPEFGLTVNTIEEDGFTVDAKVEMLLSSDTPVGATKSIGLGVIGFADAFDRLRPDILVILGDRYEIFAAAQAALILGLPIAHIHGGETTEGVIDEAIRHSITKMAHFHFVAAEEYRKRVIQLGEHPERVLNFGAPGVDNIYKLELLEKDAFEKATGFKTGDPTFLITYHPVTILSKSPKDAMSAIWGALDNFPDAKIIFTMPNSDPSNYVIREMILDFTRKRPEKVFSHTSLGRLLYLSAIKHVDVVIGNSSSGLIEVPYFKKPTVNIGDRQRGRLRVSSVIDCEETVESITRAIQKALTPDFQRSLSNVKPPYGNGDSSPKIKEFLKFAELDGILMKRFFDISNERP